MKSTILFIFLGMLGLSLKVTSGEENKKLSLGPKDEIVQKTESEERKFEKPEVPQDMPKTNKIQPSSSSSIINKVTEWLPQVMGEDYSTLLKKPKVLGEILKLKWHRIIQVGTALFGLGLVILFKMFLLWIGPFLTSAPAKAVENVIAQEASRQFLSEVVTKGISTFQGLYG